MKIVWKKTIISASVGALLWTIFLTPYVLIVTKMTLDQYLSWLGMQFILVPIIAPIVFKGTEMAVAKFISNTGKEAES